MEPFEQVEQKNKPEPLAHKDAKQEDEESISRKAPNHIRMSEIWWRPPLDWLHKPFNQFYDEGYTPKKWQLSATVLLHKKQSKSRIRNYRPITLLSTLFKTWERILEIRLGRE